MIDHVIFSSEKVSARSKTDHAQKQSRPASQASNRSHASRQYGSRPATQQSSRNQNRLTTADRESRDFMEMLRTTTSKNPFKMAPPSDEFQGASRQSLNKMSESIRSKLNTAVTAQRDKRYLEEKHLPVVPPKYTGPTIASFDAGKKMPVVTNDVHSKATNHGYSCNALGGFFCH